jgi:hypothetical protein
MMNAFMKWPRFLAMMSLQTSAIEGTPGSTCSAKFWEKNVKNDGFDADSGAKMP